MTLLADWLQSLGAAGLDGFWRPVLVWTLVCLPLYLGLRLWRSAPPLMQYHAYLALLLALPLSLALAPFVAWPAGTPEMVFAPDVPVPSPPTAVKRMFSAARPWWVGMTCSNGNRSCTDSRKRNHDGDPA